MSLSPNTPEAAVILVAGVGERLRPLTNDRPKALMDVGGETILGRALRLLIDHGVREIVLATGYREDQIRRSIEHLSVRVTVCSNPDYDTTQNSVSLSYCRVALAGKSFLKLDGDVVFQPEVLERLSASGAALAVAVDPSQALDAEAMKVRVDRGQILEFGKGIPRSDAHAETIGIERLSREAGVEVFDALDRAMAQGRRDLYYEDVYSALVRSDRIRAEAIDVSDLPWAEVDTLEDLERARALVRPGSLPVRNA